MENIEKILSLKKFDIRVIWKDILLLVISGIVPLVLAPFVTILLPDKFLVFSLSVLKSPGDGVKLLSWIFFSFLTLILIRAFFLLIQTFSFKKVWYYSPPLSLSNLIYQGWLEIKSNKEIYLTNSNSGLLFKEPWVKDFEIRFKFNYQYLETTIIGGIFNDQILQKIHKFNFLGVLFRAQSLEDYFMLSIGTIINIDDYRRRLDRYDQDEKALFKHKEFDIIITPHIQLNGVWERLGGKSLGSKIKINDFVDVLCRVSGETATIEIGGHSLTWNLPTNFDPEIAARTNALIETDKLSETKSTEIPFRLMFGRIGFRSYQAEHSLIKDVIISKL